jgi:hypothetical protein
MPQCVRSVPHQEARVAFKGRRTGEGINAHWDVRLARLTLHEHALASVARRV